MLARKLGHTPTEKEVEDFISNLTPEKFFKLILDISTNTQPAFLGESSNIMGEGDNSDDDDDDYYHATGRLACLPALQVKKYTLRIKLRGISPSIWRKIEVPSNVKLTSLAEIIITAMEWCNAHLHQFRAKDAYYTTVSKDNDIETSYRGGDFSIDHLLKKEKDKVVFEYDYGDGWEHDVVLSKVEDYTDDEPHIVKLIGGKRACPPEDCGGIWGYKDLCEAMKHPYSKHARELKEWLGYKFDPEEFWLEDVQEDIDAFNP